MKVLHFGRLYNDTFGGMERHVALLLRGLSREIHVDNLVASDDVSSPTLDVDNYRVYKARTLGMISGVPLCPTMPLWARQLHREHRYDIAHLHFPADPMSHVAFAALPADVKRIVSWHSDIIRQKNLLSLYRPFLDRLIARADAIIASTPAHFSSSTQLGACKDPARRHVVPYGIDFEPYENPAAAVAGELVRKRFEGRQIIFAVGRHVYYKGFEYLIRAMRRVHENTVLILGGQGPLTEMLKEAAKGERVSGRVEFVGRIDDRDLPAYYHAADVFCLPSIEPSEAFGIVQVEAMACRKPVVSCDLRNGVAYVNKDGVTGFLVPPRDSSALGDAVNRLLRDSNMREAMGNAGYARATGEFTLDRMWQGTIAVYRKVLGCA